MTDNGVGDLNITFHDLKAMFCQMREESNTNSSTLTEVTSGIQTFKNRGGWSETFVYRDTYSYCEFEES